jgi:hypothetical protein
MQKVVIKNVVEWADMRIEKMKEVMKNGVSTRSTTYRKITRSSLRQAQGTMET